MAGQEKCQVPIEKTIEIKEDASGFSEKIT